MEIILQTNVPNLGKLGQVVKVKAGYARNFLIPMGKAVAATKANMTVFEQQRAELERQAEEELKVAQQRADVINKLGPVKVTVQASDEGKLYGSVGTHEIVDAIKAAGVEIAKREVLLPNGVIRETGEYEVDLALHSDVKVAINLHVIASE
ncbi:MAG: 50S ribosomal protein L9 [Gammaproteobacteria bacterium]